MLTVQFLLQLNARSLILVWDRERQTRNSQAFARRSLWAGIVLAAAGTAGLDKHKVGNMF